MSKWSFIIFLYLCLFASLGHADPSFTKDQLSEQISERLGRVEVFEKIRGLAKKMGLRVYLFGGTAAGYAHYVNWDMRREAGDPSYQKDRFDYDYTSIYRSTQDMDIVVDGSLEQMNEFADRLKTEFDFVQGSKGKKWEVRSLRNQIGMPGDPWYKEALLNDFNFLNQHSDSNSTAVIELTDTPKGQPRIRDLRNWDGKDSLFLYDVYKNQIEFLYSADHFKTDRAKMGINPPIFAAVRVLIKAFQYDLKIEDKSWKIIYDIVSSFDPKSDLAQPLAYQKFSDVAVKLVKHASDLEYADKVMDSLGLRKKIIDFYGGVNNEDSLAWWLNKEPLKTYQVGTGNGKTALELKLDIVAHETSGFLAYESITRAKTGEPNVFTSRKDVVGEAAAFGKGFYTKIGNKGARGTGFTVRFKVNPEAREGSDFILADDFVIFQNKAAFRVIPESLSMRPLDFFKWIQSDDLSSDDLGIIEALKVKIKTQLSLATDREKKAIENLVMKAVDKKYDERLQNLLENFIPLADETSVKTIFEKLMSSGSVDKQEIALDLSDKISIDFYSFDDLEKIDLAEYLDANRSGNRRTLANLVVKLYYNGGLKNKNFIRKYVEIADKVDRDMFKKRDSDEGDEGKKRLKSGFRSQRIRKQRSSQQSQGAASAAMTLLGSIAKADPDFFLELCPKVEACEQRSKEDIFSRYLNYLDPDDEFESTFTYINGMEDFERFAPYFSASIKSLKKDHDEMQIDFKEVLQEIKDAVQKFFQLKVLNWSTEDKKNAMKLALKTFEGVDLSKDSLQMVAQIPGKDIKPISPASGAVRCEEVLLSLGF